MIESQTNMKERFEFRPLEPGYGLTVGNALKKSSYYLLLKGFAITSVKIDNIEHEFTTIPGCC